ncbi:MAG: tRNA (adenosine(37)-N6)-dimethylallyltransferase MiaA [Acidobacteria bacterium]|nr:tRNA (adenosine(37)-N6)-dimethylallyltransferase MiaA [Acidobacteriota bacterium]
MDTPVIAIVGPTAAGKTDAALDLAERLGGEIINADALQVYRGFDIGTAKPSAEERARVPHHLVDILDPTERYSAGEFARRARVAIDDIRSRHRVPLVVGGSGLYIRALFEGLSPVPPGDETVRRQLRDRLADEGLPVMLEELRALDPEGADRLPAGDTQRILRALEVVLVSGEPLSSWVARRPFGAHPLEGLKIGLTLPRAVLYDRIARRTQRMVASGWVGEVRGILASGVPRDSPAFQAIGYRQLVRHVEGTCSLDEAVSEIVQATRRFAKRQLTWFRREPSLHWLPANELAAHVFQMFSTRLVRDLGGSHGETQH